VNSLLLGVGTNDLEDRETVDFSQVSIGLIPNGTSDGRVVVKFHSHSRFLRTLTGEDVSSLSRDKREESVTLLNEIGNR